MKIISTRIHGVLDYLVGLLLIVSPWIFNFDSGGAETWVPVFLGIAALVYSVVTNYEYGLVKFLSMKTHLMLDFSSGVVLALSPWIFGFSEYVYLPHLILGILEICAALLTESRPRTISNHNQRHAH